LVQNEPSGFPCVVHKFNGNPRELVLLIVVGVVVVVGCLIGAKLVVAEKKKRRLGMNTKMNEWRNGRGRGRRRRGGRRMRRRNSGIQAGKQKRVKNIP
jgi:hypothetical protein